MTVCISLRSIEFKALPPCKIKLHPSEDYHYNMSWDGMRYGEKMEASVIGREDLEPLVFIKGRNGDYERLLGFILVDKPDGLKQIAIASDYMNTLSQQTAPVWRGRQAANNVVTTMAVLPLLVLVL
jgi:hypothetical protein